jgi:hypothetical protein
MKRKVGYAEEELATTRKKMARMEIDRNGTGEEWENSSSEGSEGNASEEE